VAHFGEAGAGDQAYVSCSDYADIHISPFNTRSNPLGGLDWMARVRARAIIACCIIMVFVWERWIVKTA